MSDLTHERLRELLHYEPETGVFTWRVTRNGHVLAGDRAGYENHTRPDQPYRTINIGSKNVSTKLYRCGRLAWLYMTGEWPSLEVDHRDGNPLNDAWANLRLATSTQNKINQKKRCDNKTGYRGVHRRGKRFYARTHVDGVYKHLGMFDTAEEAAERYKQVNAVMHGEFVRHG